MFAGFDLIGLDDLIRDLRNTEDDFPEYIAEDAVEALEPIVSLEKEYPPQLPPTNPDRVYIRGEGTLNVKTGHMVRTSENYGPSITSYARSEGGSVTGYVEAPASYSSYLRGDPPTYEFGARIHRNNWMQLPALIEKGMPQVCDIFDMKLAVRLGRIYG